MALRLAVLGDVHGNIAALESALADMKRHRPDAIAVTGDLCLNGPRPAEVVARIEALDADGALVVQGNTDVAVADFDFAAAFPWLEQVPPAYRQAAEWAHEQLTGEQRDYLRRLAAERRLWADRALVLVCHGSPGSQTNGLPADLDPSVTVERVTRTDARVIVCGHTHVADVRELGRKLIVNPGSCGYAFDGQPSACWALLTLPDDGEEPSAELYRPSYDAQAMAEEVSTRGLAGDVYRAATIRTGRFVR
ncbi:MAG: metallophosphatase family protein [Chloroflexota bacterium]|nr:metallophosphatase family protein [Chloroflexota bacterium]